jgi:hypothetical protein
VLDFLRRDGDASNTVVGIILLLVLLVFIGPDVLPQLLSETLPIDEGVPCTWLRTADDRGDHQSLIGRSSVDPITMRISVDPRPPANSDRSWFIRIIVQNNTIGTVPFVFDEGQVIIGDIENTSGVGIIFEPPVPGISTGLSRENADAQTFPEDTIRLLGPRQRCVHTIAFEAVTASQIPDDTTVRSYYRIASGGTVPTRPAGVATPIFSDQGLNVVDGNIVESERVEIPPLLSAN